MKSVSIYLAGATCVVMSSLTATAAATYDYSEEGGKALVVTVGSGDEGYLSDDAVVHLNANDVTNLYKRGDGRLIITNNTSSYTGHFWIQDGILTSRPVTGVSLSGNDNLTMGKVPASDVEDVAGCGAIHVCNGATFSVDCRGVSSSVAANLQLQNKTTYFEGPGHENLGALTILSEENNSAGPLGSNFGGYLRMTGDATIRNNINNWFGFNTSRYLYMCGNTLTIDSKGSWTLERMWGAYDFGDVVIKSPGLRFDRFMWFGSSVADSNHTMRVVGGAGLRLRGDAIDDAYKGCAKASFGTLHLENGAYIELQGGDRAKVMRGESAGADYNFPDASDYGRYDSKNIWAGPVVLDTPGMIKVVQDDFANGRYLQIGGKISGGGIELARKVRLVLRAHTDVATGKGDSYVNDFTNGIFAATGSDVSLQWGNLLPPDGGDLVLSNASLTVANRLTYNLPHVRSYGTSRFLGIMDNAWSPGSKWDSATGNDLMRKTRQYYLSLEFLRDDVGNCGGLFSTNVVVSNLTGLPTIAAYPADASENPVRPCIATSTGPEMFMIVSNWNVNASAAVAGDCLSIPNGELRFASGVAINVNCDVPDTTTPAEYKIAEADSIVFNGVFNPQTDVTFTGSDRWRFKVGDDGKSLYLVYRPKQGCILTFR